MSNIPSELKYSNTDEWVRLIENDVVVIGITDFAQQQLGDMVFVEVPETEVAIDLDGECGVVESVKTASDLYMPLAGEIVETNPLLGDAPETINTDPYGEGWIFKVKLKNSDDINTLLDAQGYQAKLDAEDH